MTSHPNDPFSRSATDELSQGGAPVEIVLTGTNGAANDVDQTVHVVDTGGSGRWKPWLAVFVLFVLLGAAWFIGVSLAKDDEASVAEELDSTGEDEAEDEAEGEDEGEDVAQGDAAQTPDTTAVDASDTTSGTDSTEEGPAPNDAEPGEVVDGEFPLFDDGPDLTLAIRLRETVSLLDPSTGDVAQELTIPDAERPENDDFFGSPFGRMHKFGDRLVFLDDGRLIGVPIGPGGSIDFGAAIGFVIDGDRIAAVRNTALRISANDERNSSNFSPVPSFEVQQFDVDGRRVGPVLALPQYPSIFSFEGIFSGLVGTFRLGDEGFERLSTGYVVGTGRNHVLVAECSDQLECHHTMYDLRGGDSIRVKAPVLPFDSFGGASLSPDGRWMLLDDGFGQLVDLATGEVRQFASEVRIGLPFSWTPDSRYIVAARRNSLMVFSVETGDVRSVEVDDLGAVNEESSILLFESPVEAG